MMSSRDLPANNQIRLTTPSFLSSPLLDGARCLSCRPAAPLTAALSRPPRVLARAHGNHPSLRRLNKFLPTRRALCPLRASSLTRALFSCVPDAGFDSPGDVGRSSARRPTHARHQATGTLCSFPTRAPLARAHRAVMTCMCGACADRALLRHAPTAERVQADERAAARGRAPTCTTHSSFGTQRSRARRACARRERGAAAAATGLGWAPCDERRCMYVHVHVRARRLRAP